jgi:hypothetical protein
MGASLSANRAKVGPLMDDNEKLGNDHFSRHQHTG